MEKEIYNHKFMTIYKLKKILEEFPINVVFDYLEIENEKKGINKKIFLEDINVLTVDSNNKITFYLKQKFFREYDQVQTIQI